MIVLGILLTIFNGYLLVNLISDKFTFIEKAGLSFLIGIFIETLIILFADMIGVSLGFRNILYISLFIMLLLMIPYFRNPGKLYKGNFSLTFDYSGLNAVWLLFVILICYFEYMNFSKCMYFPTFDRDSLAEIGRASCRERVLRLV